MKIRAITVFADVGSPLDPGQVASLGRFVRAARQAYESDGFTVQTTRLATRVFPDRYLSAWAEEPVESAVALEALCQEHGFDYLSLGPLAPDLWERLPALFAATRSVFATIDVTNPVAGTIDGNAIWGAARVILRSATVEADGFANLRFAALANVAPGTPFFPAAYHAGGPATFAIATQAADLALAVCGDAPDAEVACERLSMTIEDQAARLIRRAQSLTRDHGLPFGGIDFSLAPFPSPEDSIGAALEILSGAPLGSAGTLAAAALLTEAIDRARFPRCGFCGLMLPLLEDTVLASRAAEGRLRVGDLLQWSAVCGTGLDTVPLPGAVSEDALVTLLFDVAALALRSQKPLSARLMPLPGKVAGDPVNFDFAYFTASRVLPLDAGPMQGRLTRAAALHLWPRRRPNASAPS